MCAGADEFFGYIKTSSDVYKEPDVIEKNTYPHPRSRIKKYTPGHALLEIRPSRVNRKKWNGPKVETIARKKIAVSPSYPFRHDARV